MPMNDEKLLITRATVENMDTPVVVVARLGKAYLEYLIQYVKYAREKSLSFTLDAYVASSILYPQYEHQILGGLFEDGSVVPFVAIDFEIKPMGLLASAYLVGYINVASEWENSKLFFVTDNGKTIFPIKMGDLAEAYGIEKEAQS